MIGISLIVVAMGVSLWMIYTILSLAPWFPTRKSDIARIEVLANLKPGDTFYDIGSGDGRVVLTLAKKYSQCHFYGYELSIWLLLYSWLRLKCSSCANVSLRLANGLLQDYSTASVVYVFATQKTLNAEPMKKIIAALPTGSLLLSYNFYIENWSGKNSKDKSKGMTPIYIYTKS